MTRPSRDTVLMCTAQAFAQRSTCSRNHVGAVFSKDGRILSTGYNGAPTGMPHCDHGVLPSGVPGVGGEGCRISVHAEANGIAWAARNGVALEGSEVHVTLSPCEACARLMVNAGVVRVVFLNPYRDFSGVNVLRQASIDCEPMIDFP